MRRTTIVVTAIIVAVSLSGIAVALWPRADFSADGVVAHRDGGSGFVEADAHTPLATLQESLEALKGCQTVTVHLSNGAIISGSLAEPQSSIGGVPSEVIVDLVAGTTSIRQLAKINTSTPPVAGEQTVIQGAAEARKFLTEHGLNHRIAYISTNQKNGKPTVAQLIDWMSKYFTDAEIGHLSFFAQPGHGLVVTAR